MAEITVTIYQKLLTDPSDMTECLEHMSLNNFRGQVRVTPEFRPEDAAPDWEPSPVWDLELNDNAYLDRPPVKATFGQVVVFFGGVLQVMTPEQFTAQFGGAP